MKIALFVHDCFLEIGHSHAMIETLRNFPEGEIEKIKIIAYTSASPEELFPGMSDKVQIIRVPFAKLYPFFLKMVFYHIYTLLYTKLFLPADYKRLGIGIASLTARYINIQFVHSQWDEHFFKNENLSVYAKLYKKVLFKYFVFCENYLYSKSKIRIGALSKFVADFCKQKFNLSDNQIKTIYSGVNLQKYAPEKRSRQDLYDDLVRRYPGLANIDIYKPIYLFVGAYERKGLPVILNKLKADSQLIVVGSSSSTGEFEFPKNLVIATVKFTKELPLFYSLADAFLFPTSYEPFGLVITEAAAMGLNLAVTGQYVGASELLEDLDGIQIFETPQTFKIPEYEVLSPEKRLEFIRERKQRLETYSWKKAGSEFFKLLQS